ncbi:MAG: hypothetical protein KDA92_15620, partial [Planctomycetales bacterium]|nr:hypothetical protein [Planctomycetales bacterium]
MQVRTYRARSLQEALMMVQTELGPDTRVVQTRELQTGLWERWTQGRQFEIRTRRPGANTLPLRRHGEPRVSAETPQLGGLADAAFEIRKQKAPAPMTSPMPNTTANGGTLKSTFTAAPTSNTPVFPTHSAVVTPERSEPNNQWATSAWFELLTDLIEAEIPAEAARALVEQLRQTVASVTPTLGDLRQAAAELLMNEVTLSGPINVPVGGRRIVAMVGPTGVGKTTTIAKLAAHFRLREQRRVGLITVDTFRVAAVEQLRTYAEIMDMRLEVVSTPREMRDAVARLAD